MAETRNHGLRALAQKGAIMDWEWAENELRFKYEAYEELVGMPNVNPYFAIAATMVLLRRFQTGERTKELYDAIQALE